MMQILHDTNIPFMKYRKWMYLFSGLVVLATVGWLVVHRGPRYSVDFTLPGYLVVLLLWGFFWAVARFTVSPGVRRGN